MVYELLKDIISWIIVPGIMVNILFSVGLCSSYKRIALLQYKRKFYNIWITTA